MSHKIHLLGHLGERFGREFTTSGTSLRDVFKCIEVNRPEFKEFLLECQENAVDFAIEGEVSEEDLRLGETDITLSLVPAGSKSSGAKILAALAIAALIVINPGSAFMHIPEMQGTAVAGTFTTPGLIASAVAINLALVGLQQALAPDPATDQDQPENYLFNGSQQNVLQGDPVPVLYGELRVPGTPVSFEVINNKSTTNNTYADAYGNIFLGYTN